MADAHKNFAISTIATAPVPPASGTSLAVAAGEGSLFPATPFNAVVWPAGVSPTAANAEVIRVTTVATDTFSAVTRTQQGSSARTILVGDQVAAVLTAADLDDYVAVTAKRVVQVVNFQTGAVATGTATIPGDDSVPQNTEGTEFMTLAITPKSAGNTLKIDVVFCVGVSTARTPIVALFQDSTAAALAAAWETCSGSPSVAVIAFTHYMTAGVAGTPTTFKVRAGPDAAATITFNGISGGRIFGGVMASSITITEIIP